ncbi:hypothetical protein QBC39DRAFT_380449 [Podospora conica]|nr:hypothetical protein QBC39DRAFT_380449 [Schizothecium conicum]
MRLLATTLTLLLPLTLAQQVVVSSPDLDKPVDLTRNVTIVWTIKPDVPEQDEAEIDIWYTIKSLGFSYQIAANHSNAPGDRQFEWDPTGIMRILVEDNITVGSGKTHEFKLKFHGTNTTRGSSLPSKSFEIVGPPGMKMSAAGRAAAGGWGVLAAAVGLGVLLI